MSTYYDDKAKLSDEELCKDGSIIEPEYTRSHVIAEKIIAQFEAEQFKPLIKKIEDMVGEHLWDMVRDSLLDDTTHNIAGEIRDRVEKTIEALLGGNQWAVEKYILAQRYQRDEIRKQLAALIPEQLQDARIADLEKEVAKLKEDLQRERNWNNR